MMKFNNNIIIRYALAILFMGVFWGVLGKFIGTIMILGILGHEAGHILALNYYKIPHGRIWLIPFLGAAINLPKPIMKDREDSIIAMMGPLAGFFTLGVINFCIIPLACFILNISFERYSPIVNISTFYLTVFNFFNLMPFFPMDGGRVWRGVISSWHKKLTYPLTLLLNMAAILFGLYSKIWILCFLPLIGIINLYQMRKYKIDTQVMNYKEAFLHILVWSFLLNLGCSMLYIYYQN